MPRGDGHLNVILAALLVAHAAVAHVDATSMNAAPVAVEHVDANPVGKRVYEDRCLECHGVRGYGDGPHAWLLPVRPYDLTSAHMQSEMSDDEIYRVVTEGIRHRSMPSFKRRLSDDERRAVVEYVRFLGAQEQKRVAAAPADDHSEHEEREHEHDDAGNGARDHDDHAALSMERSIPWPMTRDGSGTAWLPDSTPMFGLMRHDDGWMFMLHGTGASGLNIQGSERGAFELTTVSWFMPMVSHDVPGGNLAARVMLSAEPLTLPGDGYPLLLQTGETFRGKPLRDRQHPHDLLMELAALYRSDPVLGISAELYGALAGEPALGPVAFPHRVSAMGDPLAPLSHHWLDSTHITYGVATVGLGTRAVKIEGSLFNGHEPDEERLDLDLDVPQSWSTRVSVAPHANLALQASYGRLVGPEALEPDEIVHRTTTSVTWNQPLSDGNWATMAAFGNNTTEGETSSAALLESTLLLAGHHVLFGRGEVVGKETHELGVVTPEDIVYVPGASVGYQYVFDPALEFVPAIGVRASGAIVDEKLASAYGTRLPLGAMVYVMVRGAEISMEHDTR